MRRLALSVAATAELVGGMVAVATKANAATTTYEAESAQLSAVRTDNLQIQSLPCPCPCPILSPYLR